MKLYTRRGDGGETGLCDGSRVRKDDLRVAAFGCVDELNAHLGVAAATAESRGEDFQRLHERLVLIQNELFSIGAELATPSGTGPSQPAPRTTAEPAARFEAWIDEAEERTSDLREFILPGGDGLAARLHVCRAVCRRAERLIVTLDAAHPVNPHVIAYFNRLSDLLFAWARLANHIAGRPDVPWRQPRP